ncbi:MAG: tRNA (adenosine(37)-N6)-dimethylallyltransferase MiaA [Enterocloster sp.]
MKQPLIILTGPTAVGKTALSIRLAKTLDGEIISADSMQVYRHMDIGSAKVTPEEMEGVPHHLIDVLEPDQDFNVVTFQTMAKQALEDIYGRGRIPIIAGGTGFYIQALLYDIDFKENEEGSPIRRELEALAESAGERAPALLHDMLKEVDPEAAEQIHANNVKRVIRAIEYFRQTGEKISRHNAEMRLKESPYNFLYYVINTDRALLYERIDRRVDLMMEQGLTDEVRRLKEMGCHRGQTSMQGLGYKEILDYLNGSCSLEEAVYVLKRDTRHFAKRQLTWFKRERDVTWLNLPEFDFDTDRVLQRILEDCERAGIMLKSVTVQP